MQFWVWVECDGQCEQFVALPYSTIVEAEQAASALQRVARPGRTFFVSTKGGEMEIEGSVDIPGGH